MLFGIAAAGMAFYAINQWLKMPKHQRCPAGRRKYKRKAQAEARRILRNPKNRGDRASHRAARRLIRLTRKPCPSRPLYRVASPEESKRDEQTMNALLATWAFEKAEELKAKAKAEAAERGETVTYEDGDSIVTEGP